MIGSNHELNYYRNKEHGFETMIFMGLFSYHNVPCFLVLRINSAMVGSRLILHLPEMAHQYSVALFTSGQMLILCNT